MFNQYQELKERRANGEGGFTLIELLVVVVIIGILVAIAIPLYLNYRKGAENKSAQSDIRNAVSAVESYYSQNDNTYPADLGAASVHVSSGNTLYWVSGTPATGYTICGHNSDGDQWYTYTTDTGKVTKASPNANECGSATAFTG